MQKSPFLKCLDPQCNCLFLTRSDLDKHIEAFGITHANKVKQLHSEAEYQYAEMEWSKADSLVSNIERIIKEHYHQP